MKNEELFQEFIMISQIKELTLILGCKTRWNTLVAMLERFLMLYMMIPKITRNSFFFGNSILDSLYTRSMKATQVRVSTSVKKEVLISEYSNE